MTAVAGKPQLARTHAVAVAAGLSSAMRSTLSWDAERPQVPLELICAAILYLTNEADHIADGDRLNWLEGECTSGRVRLLINGVPRGEGNTVRSAIDDAMRAPSDPYR